MKKKCLLGIALVPLLLAGCDSSLEFKTASLMYGDLYDGSLTFEENVHLIDYVDLTSKVEAKEDFVMLVYESDSTCSCWGNFRDEILRRYVDEKNLYLNAIELDDIRNRDELYGLKLTNDATIAVFVDGEVAHQETSEVGKAWNEDYAYFSSWMDERIEIPNRTYVSKRQLDLLLEGDQGFLVMFGRSTCGDCAYVETTGILDSSDEKRSYYLDCDQVGIRLDGNGDYDEEQWVEFKDEYGLSETYNDYLGYGVGYVPTWIYYDPAYIETSPYEGVRDMCVYLNDVYEVSEDNLQLTLTDSFYTDERISHMTWLQDTTGLDNRESLLSKANSLAQLVRFDSGYLTKEDGSEIAGYSEIRDMLAEGFHNDLLTGFLKYYLG